MNFCQLLSNFLLKFIFKTLNLPEEISDKVEYGLQIFIVNICKLVVLFSLSYILGVAKYTLVAFISFSLLRIFAAGIHSDSNFFCNLANVIIFLGNVYFSLIIPSTKKILCGLILLSFILVLIYSPADSNYRPLVSQKLRLKLKIISAFIVCIVGIFALLLNNIIFANLITFSLFEESLLITPFVYKCFKKTYRNYQNI